MSRTRRTPHTPPATTAAGQAAWTPAAIRALGASTTLATAAEILGMSRRTAYRLAASDAFPVPVVRVGRRYRVPLAPILAALHLPTEPDTDPDRHAGPRGAVAT